jgi:hypothetical protein
MTKPLGSEKYNKGLLKLCATLNDLEVAFHHMTELEKLLLRQH